MRADGQGDPAQGAVAEHLDQLPRADGAGRAELGRADLAAVREQPREVADVDDLVLHPEAVLEAPELGQPHVQRHLPALEARGDVLAGLGALGAATGRLALAALAATHAGLGLLRAGGRTEVVQPDDAVAHEVTSSTVTR